MAALLATGTCTSIVPLEPGNEALADLGELGTVRAIFAEEGWT